MADGTEQSPVEQKQSGKSGTLSIIILITAICATAVAISLMVKKGAEIKSGGGVIAGSNTGNNKDTLLKNQEYMIYIRKVEVSPLKANGEAWDARDSAPDIYYKMMWKNNAIYQSDVKKDSLITEWIPVGIDLKDSLLQGSISIDQALHLPIVKWDGSPASDKLIFEVIDDDIAANDKIENLNIYISELSLGANVLDFSDRKGFGLIKVEIHVLDNSLSQSDKIQKLMGTE